MNYLIIGLVVAMALMGIDDLMVRSENKQLHVNEGTFKTQITELSGNLQVKDKVIEDVNTKVDGLAKQGEERRQQAEKAKEAARIAAQSNVKLSNFLLTKIPDPKLDYCLNSENLFNEYLDLRKKNNETITTPR
jgi:hypothetical protein